MAIVLYSCNTSDDLTLDLKELATETGKEKFTGNNPFEQIGSYYQRMLAISDLENDLEFIDIYNQLNQALLTHNITLKRSNFKPNPTEIPNDLAADKVSLLELIKNAALNESAKTSLYRFMEDLLKYNGDSRDFVLRQVNNYELETINNISLTSYDRQVILTFITLVKSSPSHNNAYIQQANEDEDEDEDELEDQDWDLSVGHLIACLDIADSETVHEMAQAMHKSFKGFKTSPKS